MSDKERKGEEEDKVIEFTKGEMEILKVSTQNVHVLRCAIRIMTEYLVYRTQNETYSKPAQVFSSTLCRVPGLDLIMETETHEKSNRQSIEDLRKKTEMLLRDTRGVSSSMRRKISEAVKVDGVLNPAATK